MDDLERHGRLVRIEQEVDPHLEMAEIQRRVYRTGGPAIYFERVTGSPFPAVCNLFGTRERAEFLLRDTFEAVKQVVRLKAEPRTLWRKPMKLLSIPTVAMKALPWYRPDGPILRHHARMDQLPQIQSWPRDAGPFITLPQVYTESPCHPDPFHSNLGIYRIQMAGNQYKRNSEAGLHYQIHRGIGIHHAEALERGEPLRVSVFVGGPPAHILAAVMPLPEGLPELVFAGMLANRRFRYTRRNGFLISCEADFCITGTVLPERLLPEGPFGDHLGYYSLQHDYPVLQIDSIYHRPDPIWPFTVVGRPPQEDTTFGELIHELTAPMVPKEIPGVKALHAVDATGVHPLLLAIGSERYVPYAERAPHELLTLAHAILGFGQCSLAKYLFIVAGEDNRDLNIREVPAVLCHLLERVDWTRDLHFETRTTMDTLDYSGTGLNAGSKLVAAVAGAPKRTLARALPECFSLPQGFTRRRLVLPGVVVAEAPPFYDRTSGERDIRNLREALAYIPERDKLPLLVVVDDADFCARELNNFLWVTFTRSNPSHDVEGANSSIAHKHWGCESPLIIDARIKPHHAPPLDEDPQVSKKVDQLAAPGGPLHKMI